jgi:GNAT superfamily N-acetyltransferase
MLAAWQAVADGTEHAAIVRTEGVIAGVFPHGPEREIYNNALMPRDRDADGRRAAIAALEATYGSAGVTRYAAWVHEGDSALRADMASRGYVISEATRAMGMAIDTPVVVDVEAELTVGPWPDYLRLLQAEPGVPPGLLDGVDPCAFRVRLAALDGELVASALSLERDDDCGIFNVGTVEHARRRGIGTAITARLVQDAAARGCTTATLQSTEMGERVYAAVGFRDLGRYLEYSPA